MDEYHCPTGCILDKILSTIIQRQTGEGHDQTNDQGVLLQTQLQEVSDAFWIRDWFGTTWEKPAPDLDSDSGIGLDVKVPVGFFSPG